MIREVLRDNDIDKARERLELLEMSSFTERICTPKTRRKDHSAGSLLDPENASSNSDVSSDSERHLQTSK